MCRRETHRPSADHSWPTFDRPAELVDMVVIVGGKACDPLGKRQATSPEMDTASLPFCRRQRLQEHQHLGPAPLECGQSLARVVAEILTFLRPSLGIERMADRAADSPGRQVTRARPEHEDGGLLERHDGVEADLEELLDVTKVADDLFRRPATGVGAS